MVDKSIHWQSKSSILYEDKKRETEGEQGATEGGGECKETGPVQCHMQGVSLIDMVVAWWEEPGLEMVAHKW